MQIISQKNLIMFLRVVALCGADNKGPQLQKTQTESSLFENEGISRANINIVEITLVDVEHSFDCITGEKEQLAI